MSRRYIRLAMWPPILPQPWHPGEGSTSVFPGRRRTWGVFLISCLPHAWPHLHMESEPGLDPSLLRGGPGDQGFAEPPWPLRSSAQKLSMEVLAWGDDVYSAFPSCSSAELKMQAEHLAAREAGRAAEGVWKQGVALASVQPRRHRRWKTWTDHLPSPSNQLLSGAARRIQIAFGSNFDSAFGRVIN
jgi:hypothetical protein